MILFSPGPALARPYPDRWMLVAFSVLFTVGVAARLNYSFAPVSIHYADEHQQYLEQANFARYGYGVQFWEQDRGMRNLFYAYLLTVPLAAMDALGIEDPVIRAGIIRSLVAVAVLLASLLLAWVVHRKGDSLAALIMVGLICLLPHYVYMHVHPLSETTMQIPLMLSLICWERRPCLSGFWFGISVIFRPQALLFIPGLAITALHSLITQADRRQVGGEMLRWWLGFGVAMFGMGLLDRYTLGDWFHSLIAYVDNNVIQDESSKFGVSPWYQYILWPGEASWPIFILGALLVFIGSLKEWRLLLVASGFIAGHAIIGHKEPRFLFPCIPMLVVIGCRGLSMIIGPIPWPGTANGRPAPAWTVAAQIARLAQPLRSWVVGLTVGVLVCAGGVGLVFGYLEVPWDRKDYRVSALLLAEAGRRPDLKGVALYGIHIAETGNYFFLRRNVPLFISSVLTIEDFQASLKWTGQPINYLICSDDVVEDFAAWGPQEVKRIDKWALYRLKRESWQP